MILSEAINIMDQAVLVVVRSCQDIASAKTMIEAWETVKPLIKEEGNADSNTDTDDIKQRERNESK